MPTIDLKSCESCGIGIPWLGNKRYCGACLQRTCEQCGNSFKVRQVTQTGRFCSHSCYSLSKIGGVPHNKGAACIPVKSCERCGAPYSTQYKASRRFCSLTCARIAGRGEGSVLWRGGVSREPDTIAYKAWRFAILCRDSGRCRWCDSEGVRNYTKLEVHHIIPFSVCQDIVIDNGITLCRDHHNRTRGRENEFADFLSTLLGRPLISAPAPNRKDRTPFVTTKEELQNLYWEDELGTTAIGKLKGVSGACVLKYMKRYGIPRRDAFEASLCRP